MWSHGNDLVEKENLMVQKIEVIITRVILNRQKEMDLVHK